MLTSSVSSQNAAQKTSGSRAVNRNVRAIIFLAESMHQPAVRIDAISQTEPSFVIEVPAARAAAVFQLLQIGIAGRHAFAASSAEAEAPEHFALQIRMHLLQHGAAGERTEAVQASNWLCQECARWG